MRFMRQWRLLYKERDKTYADIKKQLVQYGICGMGFKDLEAQEKKYLKNILKNRFFRFYLRRLSMPIIRFRIF